MQPYDVAILGSGPGGYVAALRAAARGARTCCIEAGQLGGTCLNVGCIPTKAMLCASELFDGFARGREFGLEADRPVLHGAAFMQRVETVVAGLRRGLEGLLAGRKVDVVAGRGRLTAADTIVVEADAGAQTVQAEAIIIATGSRPVRGEFLPWDSGRVWTSDEATTAPTLPESVLIVGGGAVGCEFATVYSELGIPTSVVEMADRLVPEFDEDASRAVARSLHKHGAKVFTGSRLVSARHGATGIVAELEDGTTIEAARVLAAMGRTPNTEDLGLKAVGIQMDGPVIRVDSRCRTNVPCVYAVGDVAERRQYAHLASRMGIVAADNATGHPAEDDRKVVPVCVYTHPQVSAVGLTQGEARDLSASARTGRFNYLASGMGRATGQAEGIVKVIGDGESGALLGAVVIGPHASDVIGEIALAVRNGLTISQIADTIHPHPSFVEAVFEAAQAWLGLGLHAAGP